jgi:hypothetical protein
MTAKLTEIASFYGHESACHRHRKNIAGPWAALSIALFIDKVIHGTGSSKLDLPPTSTFRPDFTSSIPETIKALFLRQ